MEGPDDTTLVHISNWGFSGSDDEIVTLAIDSKVGFTLVLAGLKALLEHDLVLNLVADQHPDAHMRGRAQPTVICGTQWSALL